SFFVRATKDEDIALLPLIYKFEVEAKGSDDWYIGTSLETEYGHIHTWGTTAQGVYKAGDTIQYKLYVRDQTNEAFTLPPLKGYTLRIVDPMGKTVHEKGDLELSPFGSLDGDFTVPKSGAVGWYSFELSAKYAPNKSWTPMDVLVSDFTPAPFKVGTTLNGKLFHEGESIKVSTTARLHSGGPYRDAGARVTARLKNSYFKPKAALAKGFNFDTYINYGSYAGISTVFQKETSVDDKGDLEVDFQVNGSAVLYGRLTVESAVRDDRGKYVANSTGATYVGRDRFVGIRQKDWTLKEDEVATVDVVVTDEFGELAAKTPIEVTVEYRKTTASRVKGAGNAYITKYNHQWIKTASCGLKSSSKKVSSCDFTPEDAGTYRITSSIKDTKGRAHTSKLSRWVVGKGRVLWETKPGNTLNVFPEKEDYKIGDRARYLVQNPYPGAKALITIERYGVLKSWVEDFTDSTEVVEFNVLPEYLPGYYLSVLVFSPRQAAKPLKDNVDLGKPAFKMGYVRVPVKDPYKELIVEVKPEKESYRPRGEVKVDISAKIRSPFQLSEQPPMELAV
ncbi:MAG: large extracellular alpha-helical protein, partial [Deltaproteobacteria bacterium]|nr:large extracellular alpha-helical protein [Deltaproteobacteria bacterium]